MGETAQYSSIHQATAKYALLQKSMNSSRPKGRELSSLVLGVNNWR